MINYLSLNELHETSSVHDIEYMIISWLTCLHWVSEEGDPKFNIRDVPAIGAHEVWCRRAVEWLQQKNAAAAVFILFFNMFKHW